MVIVEVILRFLWLLIFVSMLVIPKERRKAVNDFIVARAWLDLPLYTIFWGSFGWCMFAAMRGM